MIPSKLTIEALNLAFQWACQHPNAIAEKRRMFAELASRAPQSAEELLVRPSTHEFRKNSRGVIIAGPSLLKSLAFQPAA